MSKVRSEVFSLCGVAILTLSVTIVHSYEVL
jgi:hypothetical protein